MLPERASKITITDFYYLGLGSFQTALLIYSSDTSLEMILMLYCCTIYLGQIELPNATGNDCKQVFEYILVLKNEVTACENG